MKRIAVRGGMVSFEIPATGEKEGSDVGKSEEEKAVAANFIPRRGSPTSSPSSSSESIESPSVEEEAHPYLAHMAQSLFSTFHLTSSSSLSSSNLTDLPPSGSPGFKKSKRSALSSLATHSGRSLSLLFPVEEKVLVGGSGLRVRGLEGVGMKLVARQTSL